MKLFNEPENLKSIAKTIDYIDMNKPMKVSKIGSRDSKVFLLRYTNKSGVPQVEYFSYDGSSAPGIYGWSANAAVKKIFEQNVDILSPLKIDSSGNVSGIKMVDNNSKTTSSKSTKTTSSKSKKSSRVKVDMDTIDHAEYNRMYNQAKSVDKQGRSMGLSVITSNINKYKKDLEETISNRPGAKATIKKLQDNLTKFISQKKAVEDAIDEIDNSKTTSTISPTFQKYFSINNSKFTDPKKMSVSKTPQGNWSLSYEGKRISTVAPLTDVDKKKLESAGVTFDDTFKPKQKLKTNSETYSHDINGVSVNVSKNKDGSYTLEANGKKVKSDDPSFFRDKLTPRVKKALAKEVGIDVENPTKSFDVKQIGDFISSIKTTHGNISFNPKNNTIYLVGKQRDDYIGEFDEEDKTIELGQYALSNAKRDREVIKEVSDVLKKKFGLSKKIEYQDNPGHGKKVYMKIILKPSE